MSTYTERSPEIRDRFASGWGPVLSGAAAAFLTFITFSALWMAIAASGSEWVADNLEWFELATGFVAAIAGGAVTGWLQPGDRISGTFRGFASWGLVLVVGLVVGVPASTALFAGATNAAFRAITTGTNVAGQLSAVSSELWAAFAIFAGGGLLAAVTGGAATDSGRTEEPTRHREPVTARDERERELVETPTR